MTRVVSGVQTVAAAGTAEALSTDIPVLSVKLHAPSGNSGIAYIGDSTVDSSTGWPMAADDELELIFVRRAGDLPGNLKDIWVDVATSSDSVEFIAVAVK